MLGLVILILRPPCSEGKLKTSASSLPASGPWVGNVILELNANEILAPEQRAGVT